MHDLGEFAVVRKPVARVQIGNVAAGDKENASETYRKILTLLEVDVTLDEALRKQLRENARSYLGSH